ncbi:hypothetical protein LF1_45970 [Rubripirellula obstinata]|uniref:Uncharacterized protein n=1 Tax=Rubripirellula obstinata TaxID=406547 RepID=A0A5B1CNB1_9BACT|nr:hypothetical protein [Rubripirellula obstinata]KAA1262036.1 hypothetical protein LF1_45970 [Rubripirellula obstinata]
MAKFCSIQMGCFLLCVFAVGLENVAAQNANAIANAVSSSELIGASLPTVQRPIRGAAATAAGNLGGAMGTGGMSYRIEFGQASSAGYVAVQIAIQSQATFAADRNLMFRFRGVDDEVYPPGRNLVIDVPIFISQGTNTQTFTRYLPRWAITREVAIDVLEDGRFIPNLAAEIDLQSSTGPVNSLPQSNNTNIRYTRIALRSEYELNVLKVIGTNRPTKAEFIADDSLFSLGQMSVELHPLAKMPTDWRAYQRFDVIILSPELITKLVLQPDAFAAVRHWLMMGGTVLVTGGTETKTILANLGISDVPEKTLQEQVTEIVADLSPFWSQSQANTKGVLASIKDELADPAMRGVEIGFQQTLGDPSISLEDSLVQYRMKLDSLRQAQARTPDEWADRIWTRSIAAGLVIGVPTEQSIEEPDLSVVAKLISFRRSPMLRRGVDPMIGDSRFRDWLIPGVAQPPVYTFIGLLTVFVILVGPIAYRQTARYQRSHLMFLIAPVLAIITTTMMFAYGIVSDGFGTAARIRQLTLVDGVSATGVERVRSTYFAGVRPADGLRFGGADEVMAYPESDRVAWGDHSSQTPKAIGSVTVEENNQRFDSSFLPSRSQTQFVVHRPVPKIGSLRVNVVDDSVTVINQFSFPLRRMVIRPSAKQYFMVDLINPGSTSKATPIDGKDLSKKLGGLYNDFRPILSTTNESRKFQNSGKTSDLLREVMQEIAPRNAAYDGVFEFALRDHLQTRLEIPVGHFVALSDVSDDVIAVANTEQVGCVRYIMGTFVTQETTSQEKP